MSNREDIITKAAPYEKRLKAWTDAIESEEQHVKLGLTLQNQGIEILKNSQDTDPESFAKLIQQATGTISKGIEIERAARDKKISLYQRKPKEK